jgi:hypothetical protein
VSDMPRKSAPAPAAAAAAAAPSYIDADDSPPDLKFSCQVFDIAFHPAQDVLAAGLVSGKLELCVASVGASAPVCPCLGGGASSLSPLSALPPQSSLLL